MTQPYLTREMFLEIAKRPKGERDKLMKVVGRKEWELCADDIHYWMDASQHLVPYVYTQDPHPMHRCKICQDTEAYHFNKRALHLQNRHSIEAHTEQEMRGYFTELDTTRVLTMMPYFKPIVDAWLVHPLMAIEKSRDMMATWLIVTCYTWDTLFHKGKQNIFQSETASKTRELVRRADFIFKNQPSWLKSIHPAITSEGGNKAGYLVVPSLQGSEIIGFPQGADKVRQYHPSGFFSDEAAFNPEAGNTFAAVKPSIQNGGRYTAVSSANPSFFQHICQDTVEQAL